jgi:TolB protein
MEANGANRVNLTHSTGVYETSPEFSPDGTKIVYVSHGTNNDIWVMNANGSGQTQLTETDPPTQNVAPTWSPDGTKIAYSVLEGPVGERGLHVMNANGSSQTQLLDESLPIQTDLLSWSPGGTQIAYKSVAIGGELRLVGAAGGPTSLLVENSGADYPSWAPASASPIGGGSIPPPAPGGAPLPAPLPTPTPKAKPLTCKKGFKKKVVKGKAKCVRKHKKHRKHQS